MNQGGFQNNNFNPVTTNISLTESDKNTFAATLIEIQKAWSNQDAEQLKRLTTPEMFKYFADSLSQNTSQGIANKVEDVDVTVVDLAESWREGEMEYATAIIEWSSFDYMINLNKKINLMFHNKSKICKMQLFKLRVGNYKLKRMYFRIL